MRKHFRNFFLFLMSMLIVLPGGPLAARAQDALSNGQWLTSFYVAYWDRAPDPEGHAYWLDMFNRGELSIPAIAENFALSAEAKAAYPYFNAPHAATESQIADFVRGVYRNLLDREVSSNDQGVRYWVDVLRTGQSTPGLAIGNIINAAMIAAGADWLTILGKVQAAEQAMDTDGRRDCAVFTGVSRIGHLGQRVNDTSNPNELRQAWGPQDYGRGYGGEVLMHWSKPPTVICDGDAFDFEVEVLNLAPNPDDPGGTAGLLNFSPTGPHLVSLTCSNPAGHDPISSVWIRAPMARGDNRCTAVIRYSGGEKALFWATITIGPYTGQISYIYGPQP